MSALTPSSSPPPPLPAVASYGFVASNGCFLSQNEYADRVDWGSLGDSPGDQTLDQVRRAIG